MANNELSLSSLGIQLPYNMQAEQSVLGAALMDETILNRLITEMDPDMFYSEQNRAVYEEMRRLFSESEAVDVITLVDSLAQNGVFKGADNAKVYITRIAETVPAISNVDSYIKIVKEKYQTRRLIEAARDILQQSSEESDSDLLLESAEQKLYDIRNGQDRSGVKTIQESILEVIDTMQKLSGADRDKFAGIPTGFNRPWPFGPDYSGGPPRYGQNQFCAEHCYQCGPPAKDTDRHFQLGNDLRTADRPHPFQHRRH